MKRTTALLVLVLVTLVTLTYLGHQLEEGVSRVVESRPTLRP